MNRREMLGASLASVIAPSLAHAAAQNAASDRILFSATRRPDLVRVQAGERLELQTLQGTGERWSGSGVEVRIRQEGEGVTLTLEAPRSEVRRLHVRWRLPIAEETVVLGDAWERSYGDLAWLPLQADRVLPWYFLASTGKHTTGVGVKTGAGALAFWLVDAEGISLWLDVQNGGGGVTLGERLLTLATIVSVSGEESWKTAQTLCGAMMAGTPVATHRGRLPVNTLYGSNDWYYAYGKNDAAGILRDAALMRELAPPAGPRPFTVIDDGYQDAARFPSMSRLAEEIRRMEVEPGIWIRPTRAAKDTDASLLLPAAHWAVATEELAFDPTVPEARAKVLAVVKEACDWGYDLIKHDFTTYELLGQWGSRMNESPTRPGWHFHDRGLTNAEILSQLYRDIRKTAGEDRLILGCNTVGHLAAGIFDAQRTGDDVSGRVWERTRRMGVNTLAFRLPQHGRFFAVDADCVPITPDIPWKLTEAWMQAVAGSGSVLLISPDPRSMGAEQKQAVRRAFVECVGQAVSRPVDWMASRTPSQWEGRGGAKHFEWLGESGASPFSV